MRFTAPDGTAIKGIAQVDTGTWPIFWQEEAEDVAGFTYDDSGPPSEWQSVEYDGFSLYVDENDKAWFAHHLIPDYAEDANGDEIEAQPLAKAAVDAARNEVLSRERAAAARALAELLPQDSIDAGAVLRLGDRFWRDARAYRGEFHALRGDA